VVYGAAREEECYAVRVIGTGVGGIVVVLNADGAEHVHIGEDVGIDFVPEFCGKAEERGTCRVEQGTRVWIA
jgi:hypothetical protein